MNLVRKILQEYEDSIMNQKIKNPKTGHSIKVSSALSYPDNDPMKKKALALVKKNEINKTKPEKETKNKKSHKPKSQKIGVSKEAIKFLTDKGLKSLNAYPQVFVKLEEIKFNPKLNENNKDEIWVVKFPYKLPNGNIGEKTAYTRGFMKKSQVKKYKKISKIKEKDLDSLQLKTKRFLNHKNKEISDSACIIDIILKTGLRIGSVDENETGNLGVRTLKKENITIDNDNISLKFIGKSYQENVAQFKDKEIANYLKSKLEKIQDKENVFNCSYGFVNSFMKKINPKGINPKDLRTYKATQIAKSLLESEKLGPPMPLPKEQKEIKKLVKEKLKKVFEHVAIALNNTAGMAKNSYVHPVVIKDFLKNCGLTPKLAGYKHITIESNNKTYFTTMDQMFERFSNYGNDIDFKNISDEDSYECEEYEIPEWYFNDEIDLIKIK